MLLPEKYQIKESLGSGNFGEVFLVRHKPLNRFDAVKIIETQKIKDALNEAKTLQALEHDHIVKIYDADILPDNRGIFIAMKYYSKGSVAKKKFMGRMRIVDIAVHILRALEYAHYRQYIHRDIKPSNILLDEQGRALLSDFGLSSKMDEIENAPHYQYMYHQAPEVLLKKEKEGPRTDIYALSVTLHRLINGDPDWLQGIGFDDLEEKIVNGQFPERTCYRPDIPTTLIKIINKALSLDFKNKRYQSAEAMRLDIERKVRLEYNWKPKDNRWIARTKNFDIKIETQRKGNQAKIITSNKRIESERFRRITDYCFNRIDETEAEDVVRRIISGIDSSFET